MRHPRMHLVARNLRCSFTPLKKLTSPMAVLLIISAAFLVYWPALRNGFVWDDTALVLRDPLIRSWFLIPEGFRHFLFIAATASDFYRPVQRMTFTADYQLYGFDRPWGWHLTSILIHAGAAVALFFTAFQLLALVAGGRLQDATRRWIAFAVAAIWVIHPLHTSAVTYISGRADPLAALCGFLGLALGLHSFAGTRRSWALPFGALFCFFLAVLSKESGIVFIPIWILLLLWRGEKWSFIACWLVCLAAILGCYYGLRTTAHRIAPPTPPPTPLAERAVFVTRALAEYAELLTAPTTLRMERDIRTIPKANTEVLQQRNRFRQYQTYGGGLVLLGLGLWAWWGTRRSPLAVYCLGAAAIAYLPISNVLSLNATVAEHWLYVPSAFLLLAAAISLSRPLTEDPPRFPKPLRWVVLLTVIWTVLLAGRTFLRQEDWQDQRTFIERTIAAGGDSPRMIMNLANVELAAGHLEDSVALYQAALRRSPEQKMIWMGYAAVLLRGGAFDASREALSHVESSPFLVAEYNVLLARLNQEQMGVDPGNRLRDALDQAPENWGVRKSYIEYLLKSGQFPEAEIEMRDFVEYHGFRAESWKLLGRALEANKHPKLAAEAYAQAALRDVRDAESRAKLAQLQAAP